MTDEGVEQTGDEVSELSALLDQEKRRSEEFLTKLKYLQADFENYRKRVDKEMKDIEESSVRDLVMGLLTVLDELGLAIEKTSSKGSELLEGIKMVYKNLNVALEAEGLERIRALGEPFDPKVHEAVEKIPGSTAQDTVVGEVRPGYKFKGKVIRPSMVKVELASKASGEQEVREDE